MTYEYNNFLTDDESCPITSYDVSKLPLGISQLDCRKQDTSDGCKQLTIDTKVVLSQEVLMTASAAGGNSLITQT